MFWLGGVGLDSNRIHRPSSSFTPLDRQLKDARREEEGEGERREKGRTKYLTSRRN